MNETVQDPAQQPGHFYVMKPDGAELHKPSPGGTVIVRLSNFGCWIRREIVLSDGQNERRELELRAVLDGEERRFVLPASRFASMNWIMDMLGPRALMYVTAGAKDHLRVAISEASGAVPRTDVVAHLGWHEHQGRRVYLVADGGIDADGWVTDIEVRIPETLAHFVGARPPVGDQRLAAVRATLRMLDVAPDPITSPMLGAVGRAPLGPTPVGLHFHGRTGSGKSMLAALLQSHWGHGLDGDHLPGSWTSTVNALERLLFDAKDAVCVIDDFNPIGRSGDVATMHSVADRVFRGAGNLAGRGRLSQDLLPIAGTPPRGLLVSTGEDVPRGHSLRARAILIPCSRADVDWQVLTQCQIDAACGLYVQSLAAYLQWLAGRYDEVHARLQQHLLQARTSGSNAGAHRRTGSNLAHLEFGANLFLSFAEDVGAISAVERTEHEVRVRLALRELIGGQDAEQDDADQAQLFVSLLGQALSSGRAHVASRDGGPPPDTSRWGWRPLGGQHRGKDTQWECSGQRLGWLDGEIVLLNADVGFAVAQALAREVGDALVLTRGTLACRLSELNLLVDSDSSRGTYALRRVAEGQTRSVLVLAATTLSPDLSPDETGASRGPARSLRSILRRHS